MMSKTADEITPNFGPIYAASLYPKLSKIFQKHGYALAVHGSIAHDFDLIAVPWADSISPFEEVLKEISRTYAFTFPEIPTEIKNHGRVAYLMIFAGEFKIDLSLFPQSV